MKKLYLFMILFLFSGYLLARDVEKNVALQVAKNFFQYHSHQTLSENSLSLAYECRESGGKPVYYIYNISNQGFVIVSAEDVVKPVLGYGNTGNFSPGNIPPPVQAWLNGYQEQITPLKNSDLNSSPEIARQWNDYFNNTINGNSTARLQTVNPLCTTTWNQAPNENGMCPFDQQYNERCVTGCPATAMAQIMKYWEYPTQGTGFHSYNEQHYGTLSANFGSTTYNWAGMPNALGAPDDDVALLMFHCGVAVEMNYGVAATGGSGSYVCIDYSPSVNQTCENAFKTFFGYDPGIAGKLRSNFTDAAWTNLVKAELDASQPIQYAGFGGGGGHTWVCDGYDQNNMFHMNWGWGGNSDGYFTLDNLDPSSLGAGGGTGGFNNNQQMLTGIKPLGGGGGGGGGTVNQEGISLHAAVTVSANPVQVYDPFTVYTEIQNTGTNDFNGDIAAALFNSEGVFITFIEEFTNVTMNAGFYYTVQFDLASLEVIPGQCIVGVFYKNGSNDYSLVAQSTFTNPVGITVTGIYSDLQMYSNAVINPSSPHVNQSFTVTADLANAGTQNFSGYLSADLYKLDGEYVTNIETISGVTMDAGFFYTTTFSTSGLSVPPGTYYIAFWASADGTNWEFFYNASFPNPIQVLISDQSVSPDIYENDDSEASAHVFPVSFAGNNADVVTTGSNIHVANDLDFYKIVLPSGTGYTITAHADDSYHLNGGSFTNDVQWSYKIDNGSFSTTYDDVMPGTITLANGGTVIFFVANYFAGTTGSYELNLHIVRGPIGIEEIDRTALSLFPNPASQQFSIDVSGLTGNYRLKLFNQLGAVVKDFTGTADTEEIRTDIRDLPAGVYDVLFISNRKSFSSRLIIE